MMTANNHRPGTRLYGCSYRGWRRW